MNYEEYQDHICVNGHLYQQYSSQQYSFSDPSPKCHCGAESVWSHLVDNNLSGCILREDWEKFLIEPEKKETCPTCNHTKTLEARYRVPTAEEVKELEMYWNEEEYKYSPFNEI